MAYAQLLYHLPSGRLREIVRRRAATLRGIPRIADKRALAGFLAEALSNPHSIAEALDHTDLLQLQVLIFAIAKGGEIPFEAVAAEAGEGTGEGLREAINGLEALGLALWTGPEERRVIFIPPAVRQHTPLPLPLRCQLTRSLQQYNVETVARIHETLGLPKEAVSSKEARARAIVRELTDPAKLRAQMATLPASAKSVLDFMLRKGGAASLYELAGSLDARHRNQLYSYDWSRRWAQGSPRNPVEELLARGLIVLEGTIGWGYGHILVPGDLLYILQARSFFPDGSRGIPPWDTVPAGTAVHRHGTLCRDVAYLLGYLGRAEAARTGKGTIHRSVLKAVAKGLTVPSPVYAGFVYALSREADLIAPQGRNNLYDITRQGLAWLELDGEAQLRMLYDVWRAQIAWSEPLPEDPLQDGTGYYHADAVRAYRDSVITLLMDLARERPCELASLASLTARAQFCWWSRFPIGPDVMKNAAPQEMDSEVDMVSGEGNGSLEIVRRIAAGSLYWLGLTELHASAEGEPTYAALSPRGRRLFLKEARDGEQVAAAVDTFVVQPNHEIYAPPHLNPRLLYRLFRVAEPTGSGMLALSRDMLRRAFDRGETAKELLRFLREHSQTGVPQNVEYLINEIGGKHGHIRVGQAGLYMQVDDPVLLKELKAQKKLNIRFRAQIADTVALITGDSVEAVLKQLRQAGYFPVAAEDPSKNGSSPAAPKAFGTRPAHPPPARDLKATPDDVETRIDWAAIAREDGQSWEPEAKRATAAPSALGMEEVREMAKKAIKEHLCIEIRYQPLAQQPASERVIEPRDLSGTMLRAYCRSRQGSAMFNIRYIRSARLTGETFG
jgi:hypothetical protein